jgi:putative ABC transport system substrate-binding protein
MCDDMRAAILPHGGGPTTKRRRFLQVAGLALVAPLARPQSASKVHRVGFVATTSPLSEISGPDPANPFVRAFVHRMRDLGYVHGKNLALEMRTLEGKPERLEAFMAEFARLKTEVVFLPSSMLVPRAHKAAPAMPIVGLIMPSHLIGAGLAHSAGRPGGMVTGVSIDVDEQLEAKRVELLLELAPRADRIAYLGLREEWERPYVQNMRMAAQRLGATVVHIESGHGDFEAAFSRMKLEKANAYVVERSPRAYGRRQEIGKLSLASGLPGSCHAAELVEQGCLMSYAPDTLDWGRRVALYVDRILKGAKPGELAIESPTKFELTINAKAAKALGIPIPQSMRLRADRIIE